MKTEQDLLRVLDIRFKEKLSELPRVARGIYTREYDEATSAKDKLKVYNQAKRYAQEDKNVRESIRNVIKEMIGESAIVRTNKGKSIVVDDSDADQLKDDPNVDSIESTSGEKIKEDSMPDSQEVMTGKFPGLKDTLKSLMSKDYAKFIQDIKYIAPKPTTFEVTLGNDEKFILTWSKAGFDMEAGGRDYHLGSHSEFQLAVKAINNLLRNGATPEEEAFEDSLGDNDDFSAPPPGEDIGPGSAGDDDDFDLDAELADL